MTCAEYHENTLRFEFLTGSELLAMYAHYNTCKTCREISWRNATEALAKYGGVVPDRVRVESEEAIRKIDNIRMEL